MVAKISVAISSFLNARLTGLIVISSIVPMYVREWSKFRILKREGRYLAVIVLIQKKTWMNKMLEYPQFFYRSRALNSATFTRSFAMSP